MFVVFCGGWISSNSGIISSVVMNISLKLFRYVIIVVCWLIVWLSSVRLMWLLVIVCMVGLNGVMCVVRLVCVICVLCVISVCMIEMLILLLMLCIRL